jgi:hypothetical protein
MTLQQQKDKALTELFKSKILKDKIEYICFKHKIPRNAGIQEDILQVCFENLINYPTDKFMEAYNDNPSRIVGLAVRIILRTGVYSDKRSASGFRKSIGQQILHQSTLNTLTHLSSYDSDNDDDSDGFGLQLFSNDFDVMEFEEDYENMWKNVRSNITENEEQLLDFALENNIPKMKGAVKKNYIALLPKIKTIINSNKN